MAVPTNFTALKTRSRVQARWWIEIEGLRVRYGTWTPSWSPPDSGTNRPIKPWLKGAPEFTGEDAQPLDGRTTPRGFTVDVVDVGDAVMSVFSVHNRSVMARTILTADVAAGDLSIKVEDSSVFVLPCDLYVQRETMRATAAPDGTHLTVTRGMYGSKDTYHQACDRYNGSGDYLDVMVSDKPQFIHGRSVTLYETRSGLAEADCMTIRGFIDGLTENVGAWVISVAGNLSRLNARIGGNSLLIGWLRRPVGGYASDLVIGDYLETPASGDEANVPTYAFLHLDVADYQDDYTGLGGSRFSKAVKVDDEIMRYESVDTSLPVGQNGIHIILNASAYDSVINHNKDTIGFKNRSLFAEEIDPPYQHNWQDNGSGRGAGFGGMGAENFSDLYPFAVDHDPGAEVTAVLLHESFTAGTDPISVVLQILLSGGGDATYDTLPRGWGLELPSSMVDIEGMLKLKPLFEGVDLHFAITEPVEAIDWLQDNVLKMCLMFFVENLDGTIGLCRMLNKQEATYSDYIDLGHSLISNPPRFDMGKPPIGDIKIKFNYHPGEDQFYGELSVIFGESLDRYKGTARSFDMEFRTIYAPALNNTRIISTYSMGTLPPLLASYVGALYDRYAIQPLPSVEIDVPYSRWCDFPLGRIVRLTSSAIPNVKSGARGLNNEFCQILAVQPNPYQSSLTLRLEWIGVHDAEFRYVSPSAKVKLYGVGAGPHAYVDIYRNVFTDADSGQDDVDFFAVGYKVRLFSANCQPLHATDESALEIHEIMTGVGAGGAYDRLIFTAAALVNTPSDGDYVEFSDYDQVTAEQQAKCAFQCDASGLLGAVNDNADVIE